MNLRKTLVIIGIIWLALVLLYTLWYLVFACMVIDCLPGPCWGCTLKGFFWDLIIGGIPSWILFIISVLSRKKDKLNNKKKK